MTKLEAIKSEIEALPHREYMNLVRWLSERDWQAWDEEVAQDSLDGKLDFLIDEALDEKEKGSFAACNAQGNRALLDLFPCASGASSVTRAEEL